MINLTNQQYQELKRKHRRERNKRKADKIKTILSLARGYSYEQIAEILLIDDDTIRNYQKEYEHEGIVELLTTNYQGGVSKLTFQEQERLTKHLKEHLYLDSKEVRKYILDKFKKSYSNSGVKKLLHNLGFTYKKPKVIPGKANKKAQLEFLKKLAELKQAQKPEDKIFYMDGVHPQHNSFPTHGWIFKGQDKELKTNTGRTRININGLIEAKNHELTYRIDQTINANSTIKLFKTLETKYPRGTLTVIADNARYYRAKIVTEYLEGSRIKILFLPPYAPNLNLIERLWKFFKKKALANSYSESYEIFKKKCLDFLNNLADFKSELKTLLAPNFQIIGS